MSNDKTITINTANLSGAALDWAVAKVKGGEVKDHAFGKHEGAPKFKNCTVFPDGSAYTNWTPSTAWRQGGPLIERHDVWLSSDAIPGPWLASINGVGLETGPTPLIAACRAIVYDKFGDTVDVPAELVEVKE